MTGPDSARAFTSAFVGALTGLGLRHVCISPGARNSALSLAFGAADVKRWIHHDERSAGFFAVGLARITGAAAAVVTTSGTAAAELLPAIVEARAGRVPLLVLTADRPPELRSVGAPQAIDQVKMYGDAVKWFHDAGVPGDNDAERTATHLAAHALALAADPPEGPVHVNIPFREPLVAAAGPQPAPVAPPGVLRGPMLPGDGELEAAAELLSGRRILVVAGPVADPSFPAAAADLATRAGAPVHADPLSGLRHGGHDRTSIITGMDLLATAGMLSALRPEAVLRFGAVPTSKVVWSWLAANDDVPQVLVEPAGWRDPTHSARLVVRGDPAGTAAGLAKLLAPAPTGWLEAWQEAAVAATGAIEMTLAESGSPTEPGVARAVSRLGRGVIGVASSMPVRDLDAFGLTTAAPVRYVANRGANGIDGTISMTLGAVAASGDHGLLLVGDVAALHDLTALRTAARLELPLTTVVVHNDGGGIFHFLPHADRTSPAVFEELFGTPHGTDFVAVSRALGVPAARIDDDAQLEEALERRDGPSLVEVRTDRTANVALHRTVVEEIRRRVIAG